MTPADSFPPMSPSAGSSTKGDGNRAPQFVNHLPNAERLAYSTFQLMTDNVSLDRNLGCSHQSLDTMICDCQFDDPCKSCAFMSSSAESDMQTNRFLRRSRRTSSVRSVVPVHQQTYSGGMSADRVPYKRCLSKSTVRYTTAFTLLCSRSIVILFYRRFARKQYADIEIVQTEKKGFGLRAAANIGRYAYVSPKSCSETNVPSYRIFQ